MDWNNWNDPTLWVTVGNPGNAGEPSGSVYSGERPQLLHLVGRKRPVQGQKLVVLVLAHDGPLDRVSARLLVSIQGSAGRQ
jgi:hypothetical protein